MLYNQQYLGRNLLDDDVLSHYITGSRLAMKKYMK